MFNVGASRGYVGASQGEYIPGSALIDLSFPEKSFSGFPPIPKLFQFQVFFASFIQIFLPRGNFPENSHNRNKYAIHAYTHSPVTGSGPSVV